MMPFRRILAAAIFALAAIHALADEQRILGGSARKLFGNSPQ